MSRLNRNGVKKEIQASTDTPFPITYDNYYFLTKLEEVVMEEGESRSGDPQLTLKFKFKSADDNYTHTHTEYAIMEGDNRADDKLDWQDARIAHLYNCFMGENAHAKGKGIGAFKEDAADDGFEGNKHFFKALVANFNKDGENKAPIFKNGDAPVYFWLKLCYNSKGYTQLPFPNFCQRYVEGEDCILERKSREIYDKPKPDAPVAGGAAVVTTAPKSGLPKGF
jgi:hypothetical protein